MLASRLEIAPSANSLTRGSAASDPLVVRAGDRRTLARRASSCPLYATRTKRRNERNDQGNGPPAVEVIGSESTSATRAVTRVTARARIDRLTTRSHQPVESESTVSRASAQNSLGKGEFWHGSETSHLLSTHSDTDCDSATAMTTTTYNFHPPTIPLTAAEHAAEGAVRDRRA
jgi:hypothetical protein